MELLDIGGELVNERYFIGLFGVIINGDASGRNYCRIEARWMEGDRVNGKVVHGYAYTPGGDNEEEEYNEAMTEALTIIRKHGVSDPKENLLQGIEYRLCEIRDGE